jgi:hypothetical protein
MRLVHTQFLRLEEFFDNTIPTYAILSHRWTENEVSFQEMQDTILSYRRAEKEVTFQELQESREEWGPGFSKIMQCCHLARKRGFQWVWIDTCCIDKKSSAELSEAINSMFRWYATAKECYAFLSDVLWVKGENGGYESSRVEFCQSAWFTRGWTLQELLGPSTLFFLDCRWEMIGTKVDLSAEVSVATGIPEKYKSNLHTASVAMKMSWASKRETSRVEDMAYCLLGIFDINMPLLYGEGKKAFLRLQLEIIKKSDDESIFAWTFRKPCSGLLATWPDSFEDSGDITGRVQYDEFRRPYSMTNTGLEFHVPCASALKGDGGTVQRDLWHVGDRMPLTLSCSKVDAKGASLVVKIYLCKQGHTWSRIDCHKLDLSRSIKSAKNFLGAYRTAIVYVSQDGL